MGDISYEDRELIHQTLDEKNKLRNIANRIKKIPFNFRKSDGSLDLDKVHLALQDYQK